MSEPKTEALELAHEAQPMATRQPDLQPITILQQAIQSGVTKENVEVVKELLAMVREQRADEAKSAFARSFVQLRRNMPEIYADKEAKVDGKVVYAYCSEEEISKKLEPHLLAHGFTMLPGQVMENGLITMNVTLIHEAGHEQTRGYTVHAGTPNKMKDMTACDTGAATSAWRHLMIKMFGLKSRIQAGNDARNLGDNITKEQARDIQQRAMATGSDIKALLQFAGSPIPDNATAEQIDIAFLNIKAGKLGPIDSALRRKENTR